MIPVETVVKKLIVEYEFVILPGYGAIISRQIPAGYDKDSGIFSPPDKRLAFNESLKLDDGLVANYISRHEQVSHSDAVQHVRRYTDRLWSILLAGGEAKIPGIGNFNTNGEGKLVFNPEPENQFTNEWYGFRNVNARLFDKHIVSTLAPERVDTAVQAEVLELDSSEKRGTSWWGWSSAAMLLGLITYFSFVFVSGDFANKSTLNPFSGLFEVSKSADNREVMDKVVASPAPVIPAPSETTENLVEDSNQTHIVVKEEVSTPVAEKAVAESVANEDKFYVIAGAFKGNRQANVLLEQLKKKGFDKAVLLPADERSSKVKVAVNVYGEEAEAHAASRKLKDVIGEPGWVYELR